LRRASSPFRKQRGKLEADSLSLFDARENVRAGLLAGDRSGVLVLAPGDEHRRARFKAP